MKTKSLVLVLILLPLFAYSQIEKGTLHLDGNAGIDIQFVLQSEENTQSIGVQPTILHFVNRRIGIGGTFGLGFYRSSSGNGFTQFVSTSANIILQPTIRYYPFNPEELPIKLFVEGRGIYGINFSSDNTVNANNSLQRWGFSGSAGLNYFLTPYLALEGKAYYQNVSFETISIIDGEKGTSNYDVLGLTVGLRFFLHDPEEDEEFYSMDAFLQGSKILGGSLDLSGFLPGQANTFGLSPKFGYFIWDRFAVGLGLEYSNSSNKDADYTSNYWGIEPFARYYVPLTDQLQFFPHASYNFNRSSIDLNGNESEITTRILKPGLGVNTFLADRVGLEAIFGFALLSTTGQNLVGVRNERNVVFLDVALIYLLK